MGPNVPPRLCVDVVRYNRVQQGRCGSHMLSDAKASLFWNGQGMGKEWARNRLVIPVSGSMRGTFLAPIDILADYLFGSFCASLWMLGERAGLSNGIDD